jgi:hypothetical protein
MVVLPVRYVFLVCTLVFFVTCARCTCPGSPTNLPITDATSMAMVANVTQGTMFIAGPADNELRVVHVWGTSYEMGYAQGLLLRDVLPQVYSTFVAYVEALVEADIKNNKWIKLLPLEIRTALESASLSEALELTYKATRQYTPQVSIHFGRFLDFSHLISFLHINLSAAPLSVFAP